jgi:hypothetical protein
MERIMARLRNAPASTQMLRLWCRRIENDKACISPATHSPITSNAQQTTPKTVALPDKPFRAAGVQGIPSPFRAGLRQLLSETQTDLSVSPDFHLLISPGSVGLCRYDRSSSKSSFARLRMRLLSTLMIASARSRFVCWSSRTFSSTVSLEIMR